MLLKAELLDISHLQNNHNRDFTIHVSFIEVYKEDLRDLLDRETSSKDMHIREDEQGNTGERRKENERVRKRVSDPC